MTMTRKNYRQAAAQLREDRKRNLSEEMWRMSVAEWAERYAADNPNFDRVRFLRACGIEIAPEVKELAAIIKRVARAGGACQCEWCARLRGQGVPEEDWCECEACTVTRNKLDCTWPQHLARKGV